MKELDPDDPRRTPIHLRRELLAQGLNDRAISRMLRRKEIARVRRGAFAAHDAWATLDSVGRHGLLVRAAIKQARTQVVASHGSALPEWNAPTWGFDLTLAHLTRTDGKSGRKEAGVNQHSGALLPGDYLVRNGILVTSPTRTALDVTTVAPTESALAAVCYFLHHGLTTKELLGERYRADGGGAGMANWPYSLSTDLVLRLADARVESVLEARGLYFCFQQSLPAPELQLEIHDNGRVVARLDFAWPNYGIWAEFDGNIKYTDFRRPGESVAEFVLREKRRQDRVSELTGWRCIRITWADLAQPELLAARIRRMLANSARVS
jgi:hypothetical protein